MAPKKKKKSMTPAEKRAFIQGTQYGAAGKSLTAKELKEINNNPLNKNKGKGKVGDAFGRGISSGRQERAASKRGGAMPTPKKKMVTQVLVPKKGPAARIAAAAKKKAK